MAYVYKPYPKWIDLADGSRIIVQNEAEHALHKAPVQPVPAVEDSKDALVAEAEARGVKIDKRWNIERLKAVLEKN